MRKLAAASIGVAMFGGLFVAAHNATPPVVPALFKIGSIAIHDGSTTPAMCSVLDLQTGRETIRWPERSPGLCVTADMPGYRP